MSEKPRSGKKTPGLATLSTVYTRPVDTVHTGLETYMASYPSVWRTNYKYPSQVNYGCILHHFRDTLTYWLKIAQFSHPPSSPHALYSASPLRVKLSELSNDPR